MNHRGKPRYFSRTRVKCRAKISWLEEYKLNQHLHTVQWVNALLRISGGTNEYHDTLISKWTSCTSAKEILSNFGLGGIYGDYETFTIKEITQHLGLYALNVLSNSPHIEQKLKSQYEDPVNDLTFVTYIIRRTHQSTTRSSVFICSTRSNAVNSVTKAST